MSPVSLICGKCKRMRPCGCPNTSPARQQKAKLKRYASSRWKKTRAVVLARDGFRCVTCGTSDDLTVDLLVGFDHAAARPDDCVTRCRVCHGRKDGGVRRGAAPRE